MSHGSDLVVALTVRYSYIPLRSGVNIKVEFSIGSIFLSFQATEYTISFSSDENSNFMFPFSSGTAMAGETLKAGPIPVEWVTHG